MGAGTVVTFYSYKGGTGRSMSLANVAWILASNGHRVLVMDWDLEAPGLHRYFHPFLPDDKLRSSPGVIDMMWEFAHAAMDPLASDAPDWHVPYARTSPYVVSIEHEFADGGTIDMIPAGRQDSTYSALVSTFDWDNFYDRLGGGGFLEALRTDMRERYDYVLVDSRTGLSDTAGICTVALPDVVVTCFSMSTQSIDGAAAVAGSIAQQRPDELRILPVPMRVENGEHDKLESSRDYARHVFDSFLWHVDDLDRYWGQVEVPYRSYYAYEEILATVGDRPQQENTILAATERLVDYLTQGAITSLVAVESEHKRRELLTLFLRPKASTLPQPQRERPDFKVFVAYPGGSAGTAANAKKLLSLLREQEFDVALDPNLQGWAVTFKRTKLIVLHEEDVRGSETGIEWDFDDVIHLRSDDLDHDDSVAQLIEDLLTPTSTRLPPLSVDEWPWGLQAVNTMRASVGEDLTLRTTDMTPHEASPLEARWKAGELEGSAATLADIFVRTPSRKLIILGPPGSGKTVTVLRLARSMLGYPNDPVPVALSVSAWRPTTEYFDDWVVRNIAENYPTLPPSGNLEGDITRLVRLGVLVPMIDGLDELPAQEHESALRQIADTKTPVIATCRTREYLQVYGGLKLTRASIVHLLPIQLDAALRYLTENTIRRDQHTRKALDRLHGRPGTALTHVLTSPAMITLARSYLDSPRADIEQLAAMKSPGEVREALVSSYVEEAFGRRLQRPGEPDYGSPRTQGWLTFIATRPGATFRWWTLHESVPAFAERLYLWIFGLAITIPSGLGILLALDGPYVMASFLPPLSLLVTVAAAIPTPRFPPPRIMGYLSPSVRRYSQPSDEKNVRAAHSERNSTLLVLVVTALAGVLMGIVYGAFTTKSFSGAATEATYQVAATLGGLWFGGAVGVAFAMTTAWSRYVVSRLLLGPRRLPWRLQRFLNDANQRGILRRVGSTYVFRDKRLADVLAERRHH